MDAFEIFKRPLDQNIKRPVALLPFKQGGSVFRNGGALVLEKYQSENMPARCKNSMSDTPPVNSFKISWTMHTILLHSQGNLDLAQPPTCCTHLCFCWSQSLTPAYRISHHGVRSLPFMSPPRATPVYRYLARGAHVASQGITYCERLAP